MSSSPLVPVERLLTWYDANARDLPWRRPGTSVWAVLVSEVMLQQTPVARVVPAFEAWVERWPTPAALAAEPPGEAVRAWGRLGYPRRALRLHEAATVIVGRHGGQVPAALEDLLALPGVGTYTARAVAVFAFRQRHPVVDTNVRRVLARLVEGRSDPETRSVSARDLALVDSVLPADEQTAARVSVALMELGALACVARAPRCDQCPVAAGCRWLAVGSPPGPARTGQPYVGTDRQARGRLLGVLRDAPTGVPAAALAAAWEPTDQRERALAGLVADGLAVVDGTGAYALPGTRPGTG